MPDPFETGDELKKQYLDKALHANEDAASGAKFSDLFDKESSIYKDPTAPVEAAPKPEVPEKPTIDADGYPIIQNVHTYKEDLAGIVNSDKLSLSRIAMMQGDAARKSEVPAMEDTVQKKSMIFYIVSAALVLIGIGIVGGIYMITKSKNDAATAVATAPKEKYIIFAEKNQTIDITKTTKTEMGQSMRNTASKFQEEDSVMQIVPYINDGDNTYNADISKLLSTFGQRAPDELIRTLYSKYFLGIYSKKGRSDPFLLMFTNSYDNSYPALLSWEGFMKDDLTWMFDTTAKTASGTPALLSFKDRVIANTDARSFEDADGKVAFFYTFLDPNTILFARNTDTVRKVQDRLREAKFQ